MSILSLDKVRVERRKLEERQIVLTLPAELLPPSVNACYTNIPGKGRAKTATYKRWIEQAGIYLNPQVRGAFAERVDIQIEIEDKHPARDASNHTKPMEDLLVRIGVIQDDRAKYVRKASSEWADIEGVRIVVARCA